MKASKCLPLFVLFLVVGLPPFAVQAQPGQQTTVGVIGGVVEQREQQDKDRTVTFQFKLETAVNGISLRLSKKATEAADVVKLPDDWKAVKDKDGITMTGPATSNPFGRIDFPQSFASELDKELKKALTYEFKLGDLNLGSQKFDVKNTDPVKTVKPNDAADLPNSVRTESNFSFNPYDGFKDPDGKWRVGLKNGETTPLDTSSSLATSDYMLGATWDRSVKRIGGAGDQNKSAIAPMYPDGKIVVIPSIPGLKDGAKLVFEFENKFGERLVDGEADTKVFDGSIDKRLGSPPSLISCTPKVFVGSKVCVCGYFPNDFSRNQLLLDGKPIGSPVAGSTDMVVIDSKGLAPGRHVITWNWRAFQDWTNTFTGPSPSDTERVEFVVLEVRGTIDQNKLFTGQGTDLRLEIVGSNEQLSIELKNETPDIIDLDGGQTQVVQTTVGALGGPNTIVKHVTGIKRGPFSITYKLTLPPCPCTGEQTAEIGGQLSGAVKREPRNPPSIASPEACEKNLARCKELALKLAKLESQYQGALEGCDRGGYRFNPGLIRDKFLTDCKQQQRDYFEPKIKETRELLFVCEGRYYEVCTKPVTKPVEGPTNVSPPPIEPETKLPKNRCAEISNECQEIRETIERTRVKQKNYEQYCDQKAREEFPGTDQAEQRNRSAKACKDFLNETDIDPFMKSQEAKLADCVKRYEDCLKGAGSSAGAAGPSTGTSTPGIPSPLDTVEQPPKVPATPPGQVGGANTVTPLPQDATVKTPQDCTRISKECQGLREGIEAVQQRHKKWDEDCDAQALKAFPDADSKLRPTAAKSCKDGIREHFTRQVRELEALLTACEKRRQDCLSGVGVENAVPPATPGPPPQDPNVKTPDDCTRLSKECQGLREGIEAVQQRHKKWEADCDAEASRAWPDSDQIKPRATAAKACKDNIREHFNRQVRELEELLADCQKRYQSCIKATGISRIYQPYLHNSLFSNDALGIDLRFRGCFAGS